MAKKLKLPKRIAGIKIPKTIRKGPVGDFMRSRAGQLVIAEALVAAAGVFTVRKADENLDAAQAAKHPGDSARRIVQSLTDSGADQTQRLTFALKEAARAFKAAMESGPESAPPGQESPAKTEPEPNAKKKTLTPREPGSIPH
jgi:hypothetical protein